MQATESKTQTFTYGTTPTEVIKAALEGDDELQEGLYPMSLVGEAKTIVTKLVNVGIDSHLEACFIPDRGDAFEDTGFRLECKVSQKSLLVLLRRMTEGFLFNLDEDEEDEAMSLRSCILQTIGIEEV